MHFVALSAPHIPSSFSISIVVLFAESAVPSDDDDMIGYDVGLRPRPQPTAAETPRRRLLQRLPAIVVRSFVLRTAWQGILSEVVADGKRNTGNVYTVSSLCI